MHERVSRLELGVVAFATAMVLVGSTWHEVWDQPLGVDALRYLKNALAFATGDLSDYHPWRGPLHAWLTALLAPLAGGLVPASKLLGVGSVVATVPLSWWLGRTTLGPRAALWGVALLAACPDLWLVGRFSTPYPLLMALVVGGLALGAAGLRGPPAWLGASGVVLGLAVVTDGRAWGPMGSLVLVLLGMVAIQRERRLLLLGAAVALPLLTLGTSQALLALSGVELAPFAEQLRSHSELFRGGPPACVPWAGQLPSAGSLLGECGRTLLVENLDRAGRALPWPVVALGFLWSVGLWPSEDRPRWGGALLALPVLAVLPTLVATFAYHRYLLPVAPLAALLLGAGMLRVGEWGAHRLPRARWLGWALPALLVVALLASWHLLPGSPWVEATRPSRPGPRAVLGQVHPMTAAARVLSAEAGPEDRVIDCVNADLSVRLHPHRVVALGHPSGLSPRCRTLLEEGPQQEGPVWLLVRTREEDRAHPGWSLAWEEEEPRGARLWVLERGG